MARVASGLPGVGYEGKFGNAVFYRVGEETLMRERVTPANPRTAAQTQGRTAFGRAAQGWKALSDAEFAAWEAAGGYRAYMSLTRRWLSVHPHGTPPTAPPSGAFLGDAVRLTAAGGAVLTLGADRANSAGVVTEALVQAVETLRRKPKARGWRTVGFVAFADGSRSASFALAKGTYAVAIRFVDGGTGQATATAPLGAVAVG